jgi:hypothetical protein
MRRQDRAMTVAAPFHRPRLTGSRTLVWRSRTDLQIGLDDDAVVLAAVPRHTEDLVRLLDGHHTLGDLSRELPEAWVTWVVANLARHDRLAEGPAARVPVPLVRVLGSGALAAAVGRGLLDAGVRLRLTDTSRESALRVEHLARLLGQGLRPTDRPIVEREFDGRGPAADVTVVATEPTEPDRSVTDQLAASGATHLLARLQPGRAVVGPFVVPGRTPCVHCTDLARTALDGAWPVVACELSRVLAPASATGRLGRGRRGRSGERPRPRRRPETLAGTIELGDDGVTRFRRAARHPACPCRGVELRSEAVRMGA